MGLSSERGAARARRRRARIELAEPGIEIGDVEREPLRLVDQCSGTGQVGAQFIQCCEVEAGEIFRPVEQDLRFVL